MFWTKVALGAVLIGSGAAAHAVMGASLAMENAGFAPVAFQAKTAPLSERAVNQAVCMYRAKLAYEAVNFRIAGGKREFFKLRFSDRVDPQLKAQTLKAVDLAFDSKGSAEEVATLVYQDCTGTPI